MSDSKKTKNTEPGMATVTMGPGGIRVQVPESERTTPRPRSANPTGPGPTTGWSGKSRRAFHRFITNLDPLPLLDHANRFPVMVTLKYPTDWQTFAPNPKETKRHRDLFLKRLGTALATSGRPPHVWKLEFQRNGAPHFHLLVALPHTIAKRVGGTQVHTPTEDWVRQNWYEVVGSRDPRHLTDGAHIDPEKVAGSPAPEAIKSALGYMGKVEGKEHQTRPPVEWSGQSFRYCGSGGLDTLTSTEPIPMELAADLIGLMGDQYFDDNPQLSADARAVDPGTGEITTELPRFLTGDGATLFTQHLDSLRDEVLRVTGVHLPEMTLPMTGETTTFSDLDPVGQRMCITWADTLRNLVQGMKEDRATLVTYPDMLGPDAVELNAELIRDAERFVRFVEIATLYVGPVPEPKISERVAAMIKADLDEATDAGDAR